MKYIAFNRVYFSVKEWMMCNRLNYTKFDDCSIRVHQPNNITNAPINIMPHYPPPGLYRGKGGAFDLF